MAELACCVVLAVPPPLPILMELYARSLTLCWQLTRDTGGLRLNTTLSASWRIAKGAFTPDSWSREMHHSHHDIGWAQPVKHLEYMLASTLYQSFYLVSAMCWRYFYRKQSKLAIWTVCLLLLYFSYRPRILEQIHYAWLPWHLHWC